MAWQLAKIPGFQRHARWLAGIAVWQLATGLSNVVLDWPLIAALSHTAGAAALVMLLTWMLSMSAASTHKPTMIFSHNAHKRASQRPT
jgi:cytochrome c oxidase assembly protein subunit 15